MALSKHRRLRFVCLLFFAESRLLTLGKRFAEYPTKSTRQRPLCRKGFGRAPFVECYTLQRLCRADFGHSRVPLAHNKCLYSSSECITTHEPVLLHGQVKYFCKFVSIMVFLWIIMNHILVCLTCLSFVTYTKNNVYICLRMKFLTCQINEAFR